MKRIVLFVAVGLILCGTAFAQYRDRGWYYRGYGGDPSGQFQGAVGFGLTAQSTQDNTIGNNLRFNLFGDVGTRLVGPMHYGFEFQTDISQLSQQNFNLIQTDITTYNLGGGQWVRFYNNSTAQLTYTLWDLDVSPRAYLSLDMGRVFQLLGFVGFNYNWQSLNYTLTNTGPGASYWSSGGSRLYGGQSVSTSTALPGTWATAVGFRLSIALFYLDYTRYINLDSGAIDLDNYDGNRIGVGLSLRF